MRISDWSSDVCSSDLRPTDPGRLRESDCGSHNRGGQAPSRYRYLLGTDRLRRVRPARRPSGHACSGSKDRKSVVEGKSVSVRVDIGGRRIIKTKKTKHKRKQQT